MRKSSRPIDGPLGSGSDHNGSIIYYDRKGLKYLDILKEIRSPQASFSRSVDFYCLQIWSPEIGIQLGRKIWDDLGWMARWGRGIPKCFESPPRRWNPPTSSRWTELQIHERFTEKTIRIKISLDLQLKIQSQDLFLLIIGGTFTIVDQCELVFCWS